MKTHFASAIALSLFAGAASANPYFDKLNETAPRSDIFTQINETAPRSAFDKLNEQAPRSAEDLARQAP